MRVNGKNFMVGADPEVFVRSKKTGFFVSAHNLVGGTKQNPLPVEGGAVQVDGMALEFNIDPAENKEQFIGSINGVQKILSDMIGEHEFIDATSVNFDEKFLEGVPGINQQLGCESDYNAWTLSENEPPDEDALMRTVGGHIHIGGFNTNNPFGDEHFHLCGRVARLLDEQIGAYSLFWDKDDNRRKMYGRAGCFRPKTYGLEYRTLSNAWIFNDSLISFVYDGVEQALSNLFDDSYIIDSTVQDVINNSDRTASFFEGKGYKFDQLLEAC